MDRSDGVDNDLDAGDIEGRRHDRRPRWTGTNTPTGSGQHVDPGRLENRAANATVSRESHIGGVDDGVSLHARDVAFDDVDAILARHGLMPLIFLIEQQAWQVCGRIDQIIRANGWMFSILRRELAGLNLDRGHPSLFRPSDIGLDVIADHRHTFRLQAKIGKRQIEE